MSDESMPCRICGAEMVQRRSPLGEERDDWMVWHCPACKQRQAERHAERQVEIDANAAADRRRAGWAAVAIAVLLGLWAFGPLSCDGSGSVCEDPIQGPSGAEC